MSALKIIDAVNDISQVLAALGAQDRLRVIQTVLILLWASDYAQDNADIREPERSMAAT